MKKSLKMLLVMVIAVFVFALCINAATIKVTNGTEDISIDSAKLDEYIAKGYEQYIGYCTDFNSEVLGEMPLTKALKAAYPGYTPSPINERYLSIHLYNKAGDVWYDVNPCFLDYDYFEWLYKDYDITGKIMVKNVVGLEEVTLEKYCEKYGGTVPIKVKTEKIAYKYERIHPSQLAAYEADNWYEAKYFDSNSSWGQLVYAEDGKVAVAYDSEEYKSYLNDGWYGNKESVYDLIYAKDGSKAKYVLEKDVEAYKKVGWTDNLEETVLKVYRYKYELTEPNKGEVITYNYTTKQETKVIPKAQLNKYQIEGWLTEPSVPMHAPDGRITTVAKSKVEAYKKVGWYENRSDIITTVYAEDGRTKQIYIGHVAAYEKVGWYKKPFVTMYAMDGRTKKVPGTKVEAYKKVGWYENEEDVYTRFYHLIINNDVKVLKINAQAKRKELGSEYRSEPYPIQFWNPFFDDFHINSARAVTMTLPDVTNGRHDDKIISRFDYTVKFYDDNGKLIKDAYGKTSVSKTEYVILRPFRKTGDIKQFNKVISVTTMYGGLYRLDITGIKVYYTDGTSENVPGVVSLYRDY